MISVLSADCLLALLLLFSFGVLPTETSGLSDSAIGKQMLRAVSVIGLLVCLGAWVFPIREVLVGAIPLVALFFAHVVFKKRPWIVWLALLDVNVLISSSLWLRPIPWDVLLGIKLVTLVVATLVWLAAVKNRPAV